MSAVLYGPSHGALSMIVGASFGADPVKYTCVQQPWHESVAPQPATCHHVAY